MIGVGFRKLHPTYFFVLVVALNPQLLEEGLALYESRLDKGWGLTDCTSFMVMQQSRVGIAHPTITNNIFFSD